MTNFLLEILSEEIPAGMQKAAAENFVKIAAEIFTKNNLVFENSHLTSFVTPRRLTLYLTGLNDIQETPVVRKVGPKIGADQRAIDGFLKSVGLKDEDQLEKVEHGGHPCYVYVKPASQIKTAAILKDSLPLILQRMTSAWPKLMRFDVENSSIQAKWIRPIRNIACMFGSEIIEVEFAGLKSNNLTKTKTQNSLQINDAASYQQILADNFVILDQAQRRRKIIEQIHKIKLELHLETIDDEKSPLFDEVTGLCEWPTALAASIDEKFLNLPPEVLVLTLKLNQKYFCLRNFDGHLAPKFIFVSDVAINNSNVEKITKDNEKLVRARLSDAEFFISEDLKKPLISKFDDLKKIVFHQKLGSVYDKAARLNSLAKFLSIFVPHCDLALVERAADLSKTDLTTKAVAELPELQGKIGSFYAKKQNENPKIVAAIYEHYLPLGPASELPKTSLGIVLSIADKIDSIVGFFLADEKPTSSKDPYALRRAVLGIIRISFQYNIAFPIRILVEKSLNAYPTKLLKTLLEEKEGKVLDEKKILVEEIIKFFVERLKSYLKENELVQPDIINVVIEEYLSDLEVHKYCDILYLAKKIKFLDHFVKNPKQRQLIELYKRSANILAIEEKKDGKKFDGKVSRLALKSKYERVLYARIKELKTPFKKLIIKGEFEAAFKLLDILEAPLAHFFDNVTVNDSDKHLRENRLTLLAKIRKLFNQVGDLSKVEIA
ncbi:MAG: glycine--tRNA ligase subunit beta [Rickettsiales bacterium]|nr:glycine--tRNA ligase subunit beta [Rickettsiales bacterium]